MLSTSDESSRSVGRSILPFMSIRCSLTPFSSALSTATMRHISSPTRASDAPTGFWISLRATCPAGVGRARAVTKCGSQGSDALRDVAELDVDREDPKIIRQSVRRATQVLGRDAKKIQDTDQLLVVTPRNL